MILVPFRAEHVEQIANARYTMPVTRAIARSLEGPHAMTAIDPDTLWPVGAAGTVQVWEKRHHAWVVIGSALRGRGIFVARAIRAYLDEHHPVGRIEAAVEHGWTDAHRFVRVLGFDVETHAMRGYLPNGKGAAMYVRHVMR